MQIDRRESSQEEYWRERAEQLQHALHSRVVIEQAKGILSERFALGLDRAFDLLRDAARSTRVNIHELARSVVTGTDTPDAIMRALTRNRETSIAVPRGKRRDGRVAEIEPEPLPDRPARPSQSA